MSPYLITILVLVIMSANRSRAALGAPARLGPRFPRLTLGALLLNPGKKPIPKGSNS